MTNSQPGLVANIHGLLHSQSGQVGEDIAESRSDLDLGRSVPMPEEVAAVIEEVRERKVKTRRSDRVFVGRVVSHIDVDALRSRFNAAQEAAGVRPRRELRQLRNTFGTVCAAEGVPLRTLQEWMGHESITTTERYASHMPRECDAKIVSAAFAVSARAGSVSADGLQRAEPMKTDPQTLE